MLPKHLIFLTVLTGVDNLTIMHKKTNENICIKFVNTVCKSLMPEFSKI